MRVSATDDLESKAVIAEVMVMKQPLPSAAPPPSKLLRTLPMMMMMKAICIESPFLRVLWLQRRRQILSELHRRLRRRLLEIADRVRRARASHLCGRLAQPEATKRAVVSVSLPTYMLPLFQFFYVGTVRARQAAAPSCLGRAWTCGWTCRAHHRQGHPGFGRVGHHVCSNFGFFNQLVEKSLKNKKITNWIKFKKI